MGVAARTGRNVFFKFLGEVVSRIFTFVYFMYLARLLGDEKFGVYSYIYTLCLMLIVVIDPGLNVTLIRDVARDRSRLNGLGSEILSVKVLLAPLYFGAVIAAYYVFRSPDASLTLFLMMAGAAVLMGFMDFTSAAFSSVEIMEYESLVKFLNKALILALGLAALSLHWGLTGVFAALIAAYLASLSISGAILFFRGIRFRPRADIKLSASIVKSSFPLALFGLFMLFYFRIDLLMLQWMGISSAQIGWYSASLRILDILMTVPFIISGGVFPILSDLHAKSPAKFESYYRKLLAIFLALAAAAAVFVFAAARPVISIVFGAQYAESALILKVLVLQIPFIYPVYLILNVLIAAGKQVSSTASIAAGFALSAALNYVLIPKYGYIGAACSCVVANAFTLALCLFYVENYFKKNAPLQDL